ncbi:hypothetical protein DYB32_007560 [Aphanomyces invadans]|uniref:Uncharacterized protein n=1 Tax=Aphanomyces invadans TaxID=157072 RepID=A0A418ANH8_9STRA|nr:hypothetical protein DYB32_007560 [Aphanomyces invadans]
MSNVAEVIDVPLKKDLMAKFESRLMAPPSDVEDASPSTVKKPQTTGESRIDKQDNVLASQEALQASMVNLPPHARPFSEPNNDTVHLDEIDHTPSPAALFYSFLLQTKLAPNTTVELQWLLSLLVQKKRDAEATYAKQFALSVLNTIPSWLEAYGVDVLKLVIETFQKALVATPLTDRFEQYLEQYEGDRATESQLAGAPLPIESEGTCRGFAIRSRFRPIRFSYLIVCHVLAIPSTHRNFALPFREDTDSRLHFRTPQESIIFTNREKARDGFLALLRSWQNARSAIRRQEDQIVRQSASAVLDDLVVENHWWFAQLFVMELLQVAVNPVGEYDHDLVLKIIHDDKQLKNADRLRKLHQRFTHVQSSKQTNLTLEKPGPLDASGHDPAVDDPSAFSDNQRFFYDFLVATNHFQFSSLVAMVLQANLSQTLATFPNTSSITTMRKQFSVKVLQAKLLGKFLGWLHYAPCWASPWPSKHNAAMEAATRDAINMRNHVQAPLDVASYLEVARMRKLKKETPPPVPASTVSTSLDGLYALSKLILDTPGDKTSHVHAFADLATWLTVSPIVLCCLFDTVPHIPLEDPSISFDIVRILRHILKTPQTLKEVNDFATSLVTSTVSASLKRDKPEAAVHFIKLVCDEWPSLGGSIQAILVEHVSTSTGIIQQLFLHSRVMFASAMASAHVVGCVDHLIPQ